MKPRDGACRFSREFSFSRGLFRLEAEHGEGRQGRKDESRGYFYGATVATDSLEAHIGFIEARLAEGGPNASESGASGLTL